MMCGLFHNAVRATDLEATRGFYTRFLGMQIDERRPPMNVPGFWLRAPLPDSVASIHVFGEHFAEVDGRIPMGSAAVHHMALYCTGYRETREQIDRYGLNWRGLSGPAQWQLFVHDPNGVLLELTFDAATEGIPTPEVPEACRYAGRFDWFDVSQYDAFRR